jgi:hypothetical protein
MVMDKNQLADSCSPAVRRGESLDKGFDLSDQRRKGIGAAVDRDDNR